MKVLLTGGSGFVGSHVIDSLRVRGVPTALLLRPSSDRSFLQNHLPAVEIRSGSISEPESLRSAMTGVTHVIHCAGRVKATRIQEFYDINELGTRNLVEALNHAGSAVRRLVHVSSLAAVGPATPACPAREEDPPHPVSHYGQSKLAAELQIRGNCRVPYTILRPPAVYGPRDRGFFPVFRAVRNHVLPRSSSRQMLSIVFVRDLADAVVACLDHPTACGKTYHVSSNEVTTGRRMAEEIAKQIGVWTIPCPLPATVLWLLCLAQGMASRVMGRPSLLNLQKFPELRAAGWVCDASAIRRDVGHHCATLVQQGVAEALRWYRQERWL